ncbi:DNA cytosine methyltransferase [Roseibium album]|uniref:DNA cytosine methyltransferase n=1 Tax=Roseibium album TaxID=311410 RepID=UPI00391C35E2
MPQIGALSECQSLESNFVCEAVPRKLRILDLFSGIGGFSLGLERTGGFETVAFCEIEPWPQRVLRKHWPDIPLYEDVREVNSDRLAADGITGIDILTGGFPCQDLSAAGRRAGIGGQRSGLWSEVHRLIGELGPLYAIMENVWNLLAGPNEQPGGWFGRVLADLAEVGYDAEWHCIPAAAVGADHHRERVWIIAYPSEDRWFRDRSVFTGNTTASRVERLPEAVLRPLDYQRLLGGGGLPDVRKDARLSGAVDRIGAVGNTVQVQIPQLIGEAILRTERGKLEGRG